MARKLSAYNLHVRKERKAGKSMKQAAASWRGSSSAAPKKSHNPGSKSMAKRKTRSFKSRVKSRGSRIMGSLGLKGALMGGLTYFAVSSIMPQVGGVYAPAITKVATGAVAKSVGVPGSLLMGAGLIEAAAIGIGQILSGQFSLPFLGGGAAKTNGGYDY